MSKIIKRYFLIPIFIFVFFFLVGCNRDDFTCMHCGETITEETKYCPYCGEEILNSSDNNIEQCSHNWISASCTSPKTCSLCGETEGKALGHTTTTGVCERCNERQGWTVEEVQSLIKVYDVFVSNIDSADGVDMSIAWENTSSKTIKYIYFTVEAYNAVDDKVYCEIRDYNVFIGSITGPLEPGYSNLIYDSYDDEYMIDGCWEDCYYNSTIRYFDLTNIRIIYMDNTEVEIGKGWCDYSLSDIPQGLYYTWNDEYNGYEVNYRLKDECADTTITIPSTFKGENVVAISNNAFKGITSLKTINMPDSILHIGSYAFWKCSNIKSVVIPKKVQNISSGVFNDCSSLEKIDIHEGIKNIEAYAFSGCIAMKEIQFPNSVISIGEGAFNGCTGLTNITIPNSVNSIGYGAFENCTNLKKITIPFVGGGTNNDDYNSDRFAYIFGEPSWAYENSYIPDSLKTVIITGNSEVGDFSGCSSIETIIISNTIKIISDGAFENCKNLQEVTMSENIEYIGDNAFKNCSALNDIEIPNNVKYIGSFAFSGCSNLIGTKYGNCRYVGNADNPYLILISASNLTSEEYIIHNDTRFIMGDAFRNCDNMIEISVPDNVESIGEYAFYSCDNLERVTIGDGTTKISDWAFANCTNLIEIRMGKNIKSIGFASFMSCESLVSIDIPEGVTEIEGCTFYSCKSLTTVVLSNSVENIGYEAFRYCTSLKTIILGKNIESIGDKAFDLCFNLSDVFYKGDEDEWSSITIYSGNYNLTDAMIHHNYPDCCVLESTTYNIELMDDDYITYITMMGGSFLVYEIDNTDIVLCEWGDWDGDTISLAFSPVSPGQTFVTIYIEGTDINIKINVTVKPHSHTEVIDEGYEATCTTDGLTNGKHCEVCKEVLIAQEVIPATGHTEVIDEAVSSTCTKTGLTEGSHCLVCGETIKEQEIINNHHFENGACKECGATEGLKYELSGDGYSVSVGTATNETHIVIPSYYNGLPVTSIDYGAFWGCKSLENIVIPNSVTTIGANAFTNCDSLTNIIIPDSVTSIGGSAFWSCDNLKSVTIGNGITTIENQLFLDCDFLESVIIPVSVTNISKYAFDFCESLKYIYYSGTQEEWNNIMIDSSNDQYLNNATIHYNYKIV